MLLSPHLPDLSAALAAAPSFNSFLLKALFPLAQGPHLPGCLPSLSGHPFQSPVLVPPHFQPVTAGLPQCSILTLLSAMPTPLWVSSSPIHVINTHLYTDGS